MSFENTVAEHYTRGNLLESIEASIAKLGKSEASVTLEDLAAVDEFHIGGRQATENFLNQLHFSEQDHILDVGCGIGGAARYIANKHRNRVTGIDLTQEYIDTGRVLSEWVGLDRRVNLHQASAVAMPFVDEHFDGAIMMHVAMNIEDKAQLFRELFRVLKPGSTLGVYDIMRMTDGELAYPVPWATVAGTSCLATPGEYKQAMEDAGFTFTKENNRRDYSLKFFSDLQTKSEPNGGPPPLGLHTLMGESTQVKVKNMIDNINAGFVAPVELIARK
jgi:ubiquinone/menaquinone biosynthesis C-methylase UbiE